MAEESSPLSLFESVNTRDKRQIAALILSLIAVLGLAVYGWFRTATEHHMEIGAAELISDVSDTLMGKEYILVTEKPEETHWAVKASALGMKALFALALLKGALMVFDRKRKELWFTLVTKPSGHTIICGAGHRGADMARRLRNRHPDGKIVIIEKDRENSSLEELQKLGAVVIEGNALDPGVLSRARANYAGRVIGLLPSDEANISLAELVSDKEKDTREIIAGVESYELRSYFRKHPRVRMLGFLARAARKLLTDQACLIAGDPEVRSRGSCLLLEASNPFREECLRAASVALQISGDTRPTVILSHTTEDDRKGFEERYPDSFRVLDLIWLEGDASSEITKRKLQIPDLAIFGLDDDARTLEAAERFRIRTGCGSCNDCDGTDPKCTPCGGSGRAPSKERIVAVLNDSGELLKLAKGQNVSEIKPVNSFELSLGDGDPLDDAFEATAREIHEDYRAEELSKPNGHHDIMPWEKLPEMDKDVNRLAAGHKSVKMKIWNSWGNQPEEPVIDLLARSEHQRWMAVKIMDGWRYSGDPKKRIKARMLDNLFIPFDELPDGPEGEKVKDINNVRILLGLKKIS
jgi:DNA-binding NarL/FixJ family response regulator